MSDSLILGCLWLVFASLLVSFVLHAPLAAWYRARRLRRIPRFALGGFPEATLGRATGTVRPLDRWVTAPLSKQPCAYYRVRVFQQLSSPHGPAEWRELIDATEQVRFRFDDRTGSAIVTLDDATVELRDQPQVEIVSACERRTQAQHALLERHGLAHGRCKLRFEETVVAFGRELVIVGAVARGPVHRSADDGQTIDLRFAPRRAGLAVSDDLRAVR